MTQKTNILYVGRNAEIRELVVRLINKNDSWNGAGAATKEEVATLTAAFNPQLVLLGNGLAPEEEQEIRTLLHTAYPACRIIQHYGGGSGLLTGEILAALSGAQATHTPV